MNLTRPAWPGTRDRHLAALQVVPLQERLQRLADQLLGVGVGLAEDLGIFDEVEGLGRHLVGSLARHQLQRLQRGLADIERPDGLDLRHDGESPGAPQRRSHAGRSRLRNCPASLDQSTPTERPDSENGPPTVSKTSHASTAVNPSSTRRAIRPPRDAPNGMRAEARGWPMVRRPSSTIDDVSRLDAGPVRKVPSASRTRGAGRRSDARRASCHTAGIAEWFGGGRGRRPIRPAPAPSSSSSSGNAHRLERVPSRGGRVAVEGAGAYSGRRSRGRPARSEGGASPYCSTASTWRSSK